LNAKLTTPIDLSVLTDLGERGFLVPRRLIDHMVTLLNDWECQIRDLNHIHDTRARLLGKPRSMKVWERFRALSPKNVSVLHRLLKPDGTYATAPQDLSDLVMAGREFWTQPPNTPNIDALKSLCQFSPSQALDMQPSVPTAEDIRCVIAASGNTSQD
jgi:hypothetical protein